MLASSPIFAPSLLHYDYPRQVALAAVAGPAMSASVLSLVSFALPTLVRISRPYVRRVIHGTFFLLVRGRRGCTRAVGSTRTEAPRSARHYRVPAHGTAHGGCHESCRKRNSSRNSHAHLCYNFALEAFGEPARTRTATVTGTWSLPHVRNAQACRCRRGPRSHLER